MFRAIIVDDEKLSVEYLERLIQDTHAVKVVGRYTDGSHALREIEQLKPELAFLDINIPEKSGVEIAKEIKSLLPECKIIFVTAYEKYALEAFKIGVMDYVLKPFNKERINQLIDRIKALKDDRLKDEYAVCSFKYFHFKKNGREIKDVKWRTRKAKELFIYLIQERQEIVRKDILIELLWPNLSADSAYDNLYTSIYHIRRTLKKIDVNIDIISTVYGYELNLNDVTYDVVEWEDTIDRLGTVTEETYEEFRNVMKLYKGDHLAEETYVWKQNEQERLRILFFFKSREIIKFLIEKEKYKMALLDSLHIQKLYPYMDYSYFMLMQLYDKFDDRHNVEKQYKMLGQMQEIEYSALPNEPIRNWYHTWMKRQLTI